MTKEDLLANRTLELTRQRVALLDHVLATSATRIRDPARLRRLVSRPVMPVEWSLSADPDRLQLDVYAERLVVQESAGRDAAAKALLSDLVSFFNQLEHITKVGGSTRCSTLTCTTLTSCTTRAGFPASSKVGPTLALYFAYKPHSNFSASVGEPEPPFLAGAVKKWAAPAPALQSKL